MVIKTYSRAVVGRVFQVVVLVLDGVPSSFPELAVVGVMAIRQWLAFSAGSSSAVAAYEAGNIRVPI